MIPELIVLWVLLTIASHFLRWPSYLFATSAVVANVYIAAALIVEAVQP